MAKQRKNRPAKKAAIPRVEVKIVKPEAESDLKVAARERLKAIVSLCLDSLFFLIFVAIGVLVELGKEKIIKFFLGENEIAFLLKTVIFAAEALLGLLFLLVILKWIRRELKTLVGDEGE
jgi:hypothetical protein